MKEVFIYTDGACSNNPGPGGFGVIMRYKEHEKEFSQGYILTTNNRMELRAVIYGLSLLKEKCRVVITTDSQYVKNGMTSWIEGWKRRNWCNSSNQAVKNKDLWQELDFLCNSHEVTFRWVRGHSGHSENERCDQLAVMVTKGPNKIEDVGYIT